MLLLIAVITDITSGRIRNRLIVIGVGTGILFQVWGLGVKGLFLSVIQIILPVIILYLLFLIGALGAGDIKLFSVIGSIWNCKIVIYCIIFSFLVGAVYSLILLLCQKNLFYRVYCFYGYLKDCIKERKLLVYEKQVEGKGYIIYFSVVILIGFCITMGVIG